MNESEPVLRSGQSRRQFVKEFVQIGAWFGVCAPVCRYFVGEVQAQSSGSTGVFNVSLSVAPFTALQQNNGSVRVEVPNGTLGTPSLVAANNATPMVIITRMLVNGITQFGALSQRCGHQQNSVDPMVAGQTYLQCPVHFARYNPITGVVVQQPAGGGAVGLSSYTTVFSPAPSPGTLQISIAGIGYSMVGNALSPTNGARIRLQFPTRSGSNYDVRFRSAVSGSNSATPVLFSTTQTGALNTTNVVGSGAVQSVYVSPVPQVGFYVISAKP